MTKFNSLGVALLVLATSPAIAADVSLGAPQHNWTGFYLGAHVGEDFARNASADIDPADPATSAHFDTALAAGLIKRHFDAQGSGFSGGAHIGYNWQMQRIVFGIETDLSSSSAKANQRVVTNVPPFVPSDNIYSANVDWYGTARARLGVL